MRTKTHLTATGLAGALLLAATVVASAQMSNDDRWIHTTTAASNGQCWVMTDKVLGTGYWGKCPESAAATTTTTRRSARNSRIETTGQAPKHER